MNFRKDDSSAVIEKGPPVNDRLERATASLCLLQLGSASKLSTSFILLLALLFACSTLLAGGPAIVRSDSLVYRWNASQPVPFVIDNGPLGALSRDEAAKIVRQAFSRWEAVETSALTFQDKGFLELDLDASTYRAYFDHHFRADNPVVFDTNGTILDDLLGGGAGDLVDGFSGLRFLDPETGTFISSWVIINGKGLTAERLARIALHEIGHAIGLDHTQAGRSWAESLDPRDDHRVPIMYPFLAPGGIPSLQLDDRVWLSWLYPTDSFVESYGAIRGTVTHPDQQPVAGAHVVAVRVKQGRKAPAFELIPETASAISGLLDPERGSYIIPGLEPGKYLLYIEPLDGRFRGVSSIQLVGQINDFPAEYYNGTEESGTHLDQPGDKRILTVQAAKSLSNIDFVTNDLYAPMIFPARTAESWTRFVDGTFAGSLFNGGEEADRLEMQLQNQDGLVRRSISRRISPFAQETFVADQFLPAEAGQDLLWTVQGREKMRGFFFASTQNLNRVEGMGGILRESRRLFYPSVRSDAENSSLIYLVNSGARAAAEVLLRLCRTDGIEVSSTTVSIGSGEYLASPLDQLFGLKKPVTDGYLEVKSDTPLRGFTLISGPSSYDMLAAQPALPTREFFVPHFVVGRSGADTEIRILNAGNETIEVNVELFGKRGSSTHPSAIPAQTVLIIKVSDLVEPGDDLALTGYLRIASRGSLSADLTGTVTFKGPQDRFKASFPLMREGKYNVLFSHVLQSHTLGAFTGLALLNASKEAAEIEVQAYDEKGAHTALASFSIEPGGRVVGMLNEALFFGRHFQQIGGRIEIASSCPIMISGLFGAVSGEYLAALEGQDAVY